MKAVNLYPRNTQASVRPAPVTVDRFAGMSNAAIIETIDREGKERNKRHEEVMAQYAVKNAEYTQLLERYKRGEATIEEVMVSQQAISKLLGQ